MEKFEYSVEWQRKGWFFYLVVGVFLGGWSSKREDRYQYWCKVLEFWGINENLGNRLEMQYISIFNYF